MFGVATEKVEVARLNLQAPMNYEASLDVIDFMPLTSVNYSSGVIITDWYSDQGNTNGSIKITIKFLSNEVRSDSLMLMYFTKHVLLLIIVKSTNKKDKSKKKLQNKY